MKKHAATKPRYRQILNKLHVLLIGFAGIGAMTDPAARAQHCGSGINPPSPHQA
jgi:hypothetical protein